MRLVENLPSRAGPRNLFWRGLSRPVGSRDSRAWRFRRALTVPVALQYTPAGTPSLRSMRGFVPHHATGGARRRGIAAMTPRTGWECSRPGGGCLPRLAAVVKVPARRCAACPGDLARAAGTDRAPDRQGQRHDIAMIKGIDVTASEGETSRRAQTMPELGSNQLSGCRHRGVPE